MWARYRPFIRLAIFFICSVCADCYAEDKLALSSEQQASLEGLAVKGATQKLLDGSATDEAYRIFSWLIESPQPAVQVQLEGQFPEWLNDRSKALTQLSHCLKQECLPVDVWRETRSTALLLHLINNFTSPPLVSFAEQKADLVKGILGQLIHGERDFKLPLGIRFEVIGALFEWLNNSTDEGILKVVLAEATEIVPQISRAERGRTLRSEQEERETLTAQIAALNLYMRVYESTAERTWANRAKQLGVIIQSSLSRQNKIAWRSALADQYAAAIPALTLLYHYTGDEQFRVSARQLVEASLLHLSELSSGQAALILNGISRINSTPLHITIVGRKEDLDAIKLFSAARRIKSSYKRLEWWDEIEGKLINPDVRFPSLKRAAAFVCAERRCSMPIFESAEIERMIHQFTPAK